jgi:hypothetical protein
VGFHCTIGSGSGDRPVFRPELRKKGSDINHKRVLRMMREELQGSFSSIEVVVTRRGFGYPWKSSTGRGERAGEDQRGG